MHGELDDHLGSHARRALGADGAPVGDGDAAGATARPTPTPGRSDEASRRSKSSKMRSASAGRNPTPLSRITTRAKVRPSRSNSSPSMDTRHSARSRRCLTALWMTWRKRRRSATSSPRTSGSGPTSTPRRGPVDHQVEVLQHGGDQHPQGHRVVAPRWRTRLRILGQAPQELGQATTGAQHVLERVVAPRARGALEAALQPPPRRHQVPQRIVQRSVGHARRKSRAALRSLPGARGPGGDGASEPVPRSSNADADVFARQAEGTDPSRARGGRRRT